MNQRQTQVPTGEPDSKPEPREGEETKQARVPWPVDYGRSKDAPLWYCRLAEEILCGALALPVPGYRRLRICHGCFGAASRRSARRDRADQHESPNPSLLCRPDQARGPLAIRAEVVLPGETGNRAGKVDNGVSTGAQLTERGPLIKAANHKLRAGAGQSFCGARSGPDQRAPRTAAVVQLTCKLLSDEAGASGYRDHRVFW